ncbi:MAG: hypothetical protein IKM94_04500, partial [Alphaproteobacteria bacterium]|nr:hypothetical protein [Alphaproteobacteria bacterium]
MRKLLLGLIGLLFAVPAVADGLPAGYTELQYIESTGTQYIDTEITDIVDSEFNLVAQQTALLDGYPTLLGAMDNGEFKVVFAYGSSANFYTQVGSGSAGFSLSDVPQDTAKHTFKLVTAAQSQTLTIDDTSVTGSYTTVSSRTHSLYLFARNRDSVANHTKQKVYSFSAKKNGSLIANMVPAKYVSGNTTTYGMYDTVRNKFYQNKGSGTFIAGPVIPEQQIHIATTAYNSARFSPVVTELNDTIATIRSVVTNTINQTKAIADLQATKQTRPDENCPAGKKCLLVEDDAGMPHWYEIIENAYGLPSGYTALQYIESSSTQYIDTGLYGNLNTEAEIDVHLNETTSESTNRIFGDFTNTAKAITI